MLLLLWWWLFPECFANTDFVPSFNTPSSAPSFVSGLADAARVPGRQPQLQHECTSNVERQCR